MEKHHVADGTLTIPEGIKVVEAFEFRGRLDLIIVELPKPIKKK